MRWPDGCVCQHALCGEPYKLTPREKQVSLEAKPELKSEDTKHIRKPHKGLWKAPDAASNSRLQSEPFLKIRTSRSINGWRSI